jgi:hypothetical protein
MELRQTAGDASLRLGNEPRDFERNRLVSETDFRVARDSTGISHSTSQIRASASQEPVNRPECAIV